jgi:hypothetical protein
VRRRLAAAYVAGLCLLGGCSSDPAPPSPNPSPSPSAAYTTASDSPSPSALSSLAGAAESAAGALPSLSVTPRPGAVVGADVSWPQCPPGLGIAHKETQGLPMPADDAAYVVIGLTNGPGFHANPCLADQVAWARTRSIPTAAYSVISRAEPDALATYGSPEAVGRAQAEFNVDSMRAAGLRTPVVWLDVEQVPFYEWGDDLATNAAVVRGAAEAYADAGYRVGVYSTPYIWSTIVGDLSLGLPEWRAAGQTSRAEALRRCGDDWSIQGGAPVLAQWVEDRRDVNVTCPGTAEELGDWFA